MDMCFQGLHHGTVFDTAEELGAKDHRYKDDGHLFGFDSSPELMSRHAQVQGRGIIRSVESAAVSFLRQIGMKLAKGQFVSVNGNLSLEVASYLQNRKRKELADLENRYNVIITLKSDSALSPGDGKLDFVRKNPA